MSHFFGCYFYWGLTISFSLLHSQVTVLASTSPGEGEELSNSCQKSSLSVFISDYTQFDVPEMSLSTGQCPLTPATIEGQQEFINDDHSLFEMHLPCGNAQNCCYGKQSGASSSMLTPCDSGNEGDLQVCDLGHNEKAHGFLGAELIKASKPPRSGVPSLGHNSIPTSVTFDQVLHSTVHENRFDTQWPHLSDSPTSRKHDDHVVLDAPRNVQEDALFAKETGDSISSSVAINAEQTFESGAAGQIMFHNANQVQVGPDGSRDRNFEAELRKSSGRPGSGGPSIAHNRIPDSAMGNQALPNSVESGSSNTNGFCPHASESSLRSEFQWHACSVDDTGSDSERSTLNVPERSTPIRNSVESHDFFDKVQLLSRNSARPGSGSSSKQHNSVPDLIASE